MVHCDRSHRGHSYFINDEDEIRSVNDPNSYFKYFLTKNQRWNDRQRFAMNGNTLSTASSAAKTSNTNKYVPNRSGPADCPPAPRG